MKRLLLACLLWPVLALAAPGELTEYKGGALPAFVLNSLDHGEIALDDYRGKVVLVNFWATWCPPCVEEMPSMQRLKDQLADQPFEILALNLAEDEATIRQFLQRIPLDFPILLDPQGRVVEQWKVFAFPTSFLIDAEGTIRYSLFGGYHWDNPEAVRLVHDLIKLSPATTLTRQ